MYVKNVNCSWTWDTAAQAHNLFLIFQSAFLIFTFLPGYILSEVTSKKSFS